MKFNKLNKFVLALTVLVIIPACGGGGGGSSDDDSDDVLPEGESTTNPSVQGTAVKGIVIKGNVVANELDSAGNVLRVVGTATTGSDGGYSLALNDSYQGGPIEIVLSSGPETTTVCDVDVGCGNRTDGLTDADDPDNNNDLIIDFGEEYKPANLSMTALLGDAKDGETIAVQVTPYTHMAAQRAKSAPLTSTSIDSANSEVSVLLGGIDILRTAPVDITNPASLNNASAFDIAYSAFAAAIAKQAPTDADGQPIIDQALADLSTGYAASGLFDSGDLQAILNNTNNALTAAGVTTDTSGVLASVQGVVNNAAGGPIDPEPNPNVGDSDVQKTRLFLSDLRTWGTVINAELDAPSQAFATQVELAQAATDIILNDDVTFEAIVVGAEVIAEVGLAGLQCGRGNAIAFDDVGEGSGTLYWTDGNWISQLDKASGSLIDTARVFLDYAAFGPPDEPFAGFRIVAMDFHPITGELYTAVLQRQASSIPAPESTLAILDPVTGTFNLIGAVDGTGVKLDGIAFTSDGTLYGTSTGFGTGEQSGGGSGGGTGPGTGPGTRSQFHVIDLGTGVATEISTDIGYGGDVGGLAADSGNVLFAGTGGRGPNSLGRSISPTQLFTIDPVTGLGSAAIGPLGIEYGPPDSSGQGPGAGDFNQFGSLRQNIAGWSFDPISGDLYGMTGRGSQLFVANTATGLATRIGSPCTDFIDRYTEHGIFTGKVTRSTSNGHSTYSITNASVSVAGKVAALDLVAIVPDDAALLSTITVGIESAIADSDNARVVVNSGIVMPTSPSPVLIDYFDRFEEEDDDIITMAVLDLDVAITQKKILVNGVPEIATDPVTFAGKLGLTAYTYIDPVSGAETGDLLPGSIELGGTISNSMGDSVEARVTVSIPTAAADAANPARVLPVGSTYAENNGGNHLIAWTRSADEFTYFNPEEFYRFTFNAGDESVHVEINSPFVGFVDIVDPGPYTSLTDYSNKKGPFMPFDFQFEVSIDEQGLYEKQFSVPDYSESGFITFALAEPDVVFYDASKPPIGSVGLQFSAQFEGLPEADVNITGSTTGFEQGTAIVTLSFDNRMIRFSGSNNTAGGDIGSFDITNQDGVVLTLDFDNEEFSDLSINGRVIATVEELGSGAIKVSYIDGTFEIF